MGRQFGKTLVADVRRGQIRELFGGRPGGYSEGRVDMKTSNSRERSPPAGVLTWPKTRLVSDLDDASALAQAIRYARSRWQALTRYVTDGRLEMSNNAAERAMKPPVLGRKNYLFCGSDAGGKRAACIYTILETAKMCGINPQAYLADVLNRIADHPIRQIDTLLPWRWSEQ